MRGRAKTAMIGAWLLACTGCGALAPGNAVVPRSSTTATARTTPSVPAATNLSCADVTTTTPIEQVSPACQQRWEPYGVTEVPPTNELAQERVPAVQAVTNMTNGAISDKTALHWANASNWDSGWWKWAEGNDQLFMLRTLVAPSEIPADEVDVLQNGGTIEQPNCDLYPLSWKLFPVDATARAYFARRNLQTTAAYVFVIDYSGPAVRRSARRAARPRSVSISPRTRLSSSRAPCAMTRCSVTSGLRIPPATARTQTVLLLSGAAGDATGSPDVRDGRDMRTARADARCRCHRRGRWPRHGTSAGSVE